MTKQEANRLAAVEVKIDSLGEKIDALEKSFIDKIAAQEKAFNITQVGQKEAINIAMAASEKAIGKAEVANDLKFSEIDRRYNDSIAGLTASIKTLTETQTLNAGAKTGIKDFQSWITWGLMIIGFVITYFVLRGV